jgi:hypothetical protein
MVTILKSKTVKTKKVHRCSGCAKKIPIGASVDYVVAVDGGDICPSYWCATCEQILSELPYHDKIEGFNFGELKDMFPERFKMEVTDE